MVQRRHGAARVVVVHRVEFGFPCSSYWRARAVRTCRCPGLKLGSGWPRINAAMPVYNALKPFWMEMTGGRSVCIGALHVDVPRRVHRRAERRTGQPRRRRLHAAAPAKAAAGDRDVLVHGAYTAQRALEAGVLDELQIHQIPVLFGGGRRLFERLPSRVELEIVRVIDTPEATHLRYRVRRRAAVTGVGSGVPVARSPAGAPLVGHERPSAQSRRGSTQSPGAVAPALRRRSSYRRVAATGTADRPAEGRQFYSAEHRHVEFAGPGSTEGGGAGSGGSGPPGSPAPER
jgi:hypothetical protein